MMSQLLPVLPHLVVACTLVVGVVGLSLVRRQWFVFYLTLAGMIAAFAVLPGLNRALPLSGSGLFVADRLALYYEGLILAAAFAVAVLSYDYTGKRTGSEAGEEYYLLLLGALLGALSLVAARHFVSFFLALEVLSICLYALIGYYRHGLAQTEGAIKYLILSGASSAFLLFGMAVIYGVTGTMEFGPLPGVTAEGDHDGLLIMCASVFFMVGIGFKLGVVPFHMWTPDVYESAPAPVTAFIATVSKGSVLALLLRFLGLSDLLARPKVFGMIVFVAVASMLVGNLLALFQRDLKRLLAYSSISHFGYMLVAVLVSGPSGITAATFYVTAYFIMTLGAFGVITMLSGKDRDFASVDDFRGLFTRRPWVAGCFTLMLLSLAGMPLTAGFIGKVYLVAAGASSLLWLPVISLAVGSAIGIFYYLRVIVALFGPPLTDSSQVPAFSIKGGIVLAVLLFILVWWGIYPAPLMNIVSTVAIGR